MRLGRRPVDLVGEEDLREDRAAAEVETAGLQIEDAGSDDVRRHEVGRELHAVEVGLDEPGQNFCHQGFRRSGDALQQHVATGQEGHAEQLEDFLLAHQRSIRLLAQPGVDARGID